jgi:hypothetical protein
MPPAIAAIPEIVGTVASAATAANGIASTVQSAQASGNSGQSSQVDSNDAASGGSLPQGLGSAGGEDTGASSPFSTGDLSGGGGIQPQDALSQLQSLNNQDEQFQLQLGEEKQRHSEAKAALQAIGQ